MHWPKLKKLNIKNQKIINNYYYIRQNLIKEILDDESILNKNESKEMSLRKYRYYSHINVKEKYLVLKKMNLLI